MAAPTVQVTPTAIRVAIARERSGISISAYTDLLSNVRLMLEEIDRVAEPGRHARALWGVKQTSSTTRLLRAVVAPLSLPKKRLIDAVAVPAGALVSGVGDLANRPAIPKLFSESVVERVEELGSQVGRFGVTGISIATVADESRVVVREVPVTDEVTKNAKAAVEADSWALSSLIGKLDVISARGARRRIGLLTESGPPVTCNVGTTIPIEQFMRVFEQRVLVAGMLKRNSQGQAVSLDVEHIEELPRLPGVRASELVGRAPNLTGDLSTEEFMAVLRGD